MPTPYLLIDFPGGRTGAVLEADALDEDKADLFNGAAVRSWESGDPYAGAASFGPADEAAVVTTVECLVVEWSDGRQGGVLEAAYLDEDNAALFEDSVVLSWESGLAYEEPA